MKIRRPTQLFQLTSFAEFQFQVALLDAIAALLAGEAISLDLVVVLVRLDNLVGADVDAVFKHLHARQHVIRMCQWDTFAVCLALNVIFRQIAVRVAHISFR